MSQGLITNSILTGIANAIRTKLGVQTQYKPGQMADAIATIHGEPVLQAKTATPSASEQTVTPDSGYDGLSAVTVEGVVAPNLIAANIKKDVVVKVGTSTDDDSVMTVTGSYEGSGGGGEWPADLTLIEYVEQTFNAQARTEILTPSLASGDEIEIEIMPLTLGSESAFAGVDQPSGRAQYLELYYSLSGILKMFTTNFQATQISEDQQTVIGNKYTIKIRLGESVSYGNFHIGYYRTNSFIFHGRIYGCKIKRNNTMIVNLVPARHTSGEVGLYDTVNCIFYMSWYNHGAWSGPAVT